jgi:amino acid permease
MLRYLKVYRKVILLIIVIIVLIVVSSVSKGKTATITSTLAVIAMIYGGITFIVWIIRTPTKKQKDEPI